MAKESHLPCPKCGSSDAYAIYEENEYCHSCGTHKHTKPKEEEDWAKYFPHLNEKRDPGKLYLPQTRVNHFPKAAKKLLFKAGISEELALQNNMSYVDFEEVILPGTTTKIVLKKRIILPIYEDDNLICYQARSTNPQDKPKYYTVGKKKPYEQSSSADYVILVEDVFSMIRVAMEGFNVASLLGTSITDEFLLTLSRRYARVILWMDADEPGRAASRKLYEKLRTCVKGVVVVNDKEPKLCFPNEIKTILQPLALLKSEGHTISK